MGADLFSIAKSGLFASKKGLQTSGHNISNANTDGYSRQRVNQTTNPPIAEGDHVQGTGVRIRDVNRIHDSLVEKRLNKDITTNNYFKEREFQLSQIEEIFNETNSEGLNKIINKLFNSFRELANQPENDTVRSIVRENARLVVRDFKRISEMSTTFNKIWTKSWSEKSIISTRF